MNYAFSQIDYNCYFLYILSLRVSRTTATNSALIPMGCRAKRTAYSRQMKQFKQNKLFLDILLHNKFCKALK